MKHDLLSGLDVLVKEGFKRLENKNVALLANQASVDKNINHILDLAIAHGVKIKKIFAPEHGFYGVMQDMEHVATSKENFYNLPVLSLYGQDKKSLQISEKYLDDIDVLLVDLMDIGSRYYTFHCTASWAMKACMNTNTTLMVVDRPNPISGDVIEGNLIKESMYSFVGPYPLLNRHGFSMGELLLYVKGHLGLDVQIDVIAMKNYDRSLYFDEIDVPFIAPSPNMPSLNAMILYPGMCLIEGTNLSEGRGTCMPFLQVGAPFINDAYKFKTLVDDALISGIKTRVVSFKPGFQKHAQKTCHGLYFHITDRSVFNPTRFAIAVIKAAMEFEGFSWRLEPYEYEEDRLAIDLLLGDKHLRKMLEERASLKEIFKKFKEDEKAFLKKRETFLLY